MYASILRRGSKPQSGFAKLSESSTNSIRETRATASGSEYKTPKASSQHKHKTAYNFVESCEAASIWASSMLISLSLVVSSPVL